MGMSTHVTGFKPADDKWKKMKHVYDACETAGIEKPHEVAQFFNFCAPDDNGVVIDIEKSEACRVWRRDSASGFEIDVKKLPENVTIIRFENSW